MGLSRRFCREVEPIRAFGPSKTGRLPAEVCGVFFFFLLSALLVVLSWFSGWVSCLTHKKHNSLVAGIRETDSPEKLVACVVSCLPFVLLFLVAAAVACRSSLGTVPRARKCPSSCPIYRQPWFGRPKVKNKWKQAPGLQTPQSLRCKLWLPPTPSTRGHAFKPESRERGNFTSLWVTWFWCALPSLASTCPGQQNRPLFVVFLLTREYPGRRRLRPAFLRFFVSFLPNLPRRRRLF